MSRRYRVTPKLSREVDISVCGPGIIIGSGGSRIKDFQKRSGARMRVVDGKLVISGDLKSILAAKGLVKEFISEYVLRKSNRQTKNSSNQHQQRLFKKERVELRKKNTAAKLQVKLRRAVEKSYKDNKSQSFTNMSQFAALEGDDSSSSDSEDELEYSRSTAHLRQPTYNTAEKTGYLVPKQSSPREPSRIRLDICELETKMEKDKADGKRVLWADDADLEEFISELADCEV